MRVIVLVLISILCSHTAVGKDAFRLTSTSLGDSLIPQKKHGFSISTDLYGTFNSTIYKNYNPDSRYWRGSATFIAQYNFGQWAIGAGAGYEIIQYQILALAFDLVINSIRQSIVLATEYQYGKNSTINYKCLSRLQYHFYENRVNEIRRSYSTKMEAVSIVLGWGPTINVAKFQIAPVLNLSWLFEDQFKSDNLETGVFINLKFPIN